MTFYPNPTQSSVSIDYMIQNDSEVHIEILDLTSRVVGTVENPPSQAGSHTVVFQFPNVASGTYLVRLRANEATLTEKIMLNR